MGLGLRAGRHGCLDNQEDNLHLEEGLGIEDQVQEPGIEDQVQPVGIEGLLGFEGRPQEEPLVFPLGHQWRVENTQHKKHQIF